MRGEGVHTSREWSVDVAGCRNENVDAASGVWCSLTVRLIHRVSRRPALILKKSRDDKQVNSDASGMKDAHLTPMPDFLSFTKDFNTTTIAEN